MRPMGFLVENVFVSSLAKEVEGIFSAENEVDAGFFVWNYRIKPLFRHGKGSSGADGSSGFLPHVQDNVARRKNVIAWGNKFAHLTNNANGWAFAEYDDVGCGGE